ncbi:MAG: hypothetical protein ACYDCK_03195 [Thermoplasmatota archaeon]
MASDSGSFVSQLIKGADLLGNDSLVLDALRDLLKDEIKGRMREELLRHPELHQEMKDAVRLYFEAKVHEYYATLKFAKASAKLGVNLMPEDLRAQLGREVASFVEREVSQLLEKSL